MSVRPFVRPFVRPSPYHPPKMTKIGQKCFKNNVFCLYTISPSEYFIKILEKINLINDDNMSEVFFNYMTLKIGKIKQLNNLYLAREYPRPQIYNIPDKITWLKNTNLLLDINIVINNIIKGCANYNEILNNSIFRYLSLRILNLLEEAI